MRRLSVSVALVAVLLAACGSDGVTRPTLPNRTTVPTLEPSSTAAPETVAPTVPPTDAPGDTTAPETVAPTAAPTAPPTAAPTQPPVSEPATTLATGGEGDGDGDDDDATAWWPWVLFGVLVLGGLMLLARRRRAPSWQERTVRLLDELQRIATTLAALPPESVRVVAANEAGALATARAGLAALVADAPDDAARSALVALTQPVADLHVAVSSASLLPPQVPGTVPPPAPSVAQLATVVHAASATARATLAPPSPAS